MKVGFLHSRIRQEEKLLLTELRKRPDVEVIQIDDNSQYFDISEKKADIDVLFERSISYSRGLYISRLFESHGVPAVNSSSVAERCGDKYVTSQALVDNNIPTPRLFMAFTAESALDAIEEMGYPCVLKPVVGSWGRLMAKIVNREQAESIIEHKTTLGGYTHSLFYIQEYVDKPGRDIRAFVVDGKTICAIYRSSDHWITNTARGGQASNCPIIPKLDGICRKVNDAIGGGLLAVDIFETGAGFMVNEVNHTMEFRNSIATTGVDIPKHVIDYVLKIGEGKYG